MRLLSLTANKPTFHKVRFRPEGLSLIVGKKQHPESKNIKDTYNGVGKSLLIEILHFCLGSSPNQSFEKNIPDWEFTLELEIGQESFRATRNTSKQNEVFLNGEKFTIKKFTSFLGERLFDFPHPSIPFLTFRSCISRFIRRNKASYNTFDTFVLKEKEYQKLLSNSFLLGFDITKNQRKYELKETLGENEKSKKIIQEDKTLKEYFENRYDASFEIRDLEDKVKKLEKDLKAFNVAEDYSQIVAEADEIKSQVRDLENQKYSFEVSIDNINESLQLQPDVSPQTVLSLYKEAEIQLPQLVVKKVEEVSEFHHQLLLKRKKRLKEEKTRLAEQFQEIIARIQGLNKRKDELLKYLDTHGALDEFTALNQQLSDYRTTLDKLKTYRELLRSYNLKQTKIKKDLAEENLKTENYLHEKAKPTLEKNLNLFRSLSKEFYQDKPGGIDVENNEGSNQLRFNIHARIQDDTSDGINEVKIFCFDFTFLEASHNHHIQSLVHDSRLYSNMDPRQRATLFRLAYEHTIKSGCQYIATVNEDMLAPLKNYYSEEEFQRIIKASTVLELTDESFESKLLGIQVDMDYEK